MAKASDTISELIKALENAVDNGLTKTDTQTIGNQLVDDIRRRTRLGYGCPGYGRPRESLKSLSNLYIEFRKGKIFVFKNKNNKTVVANSKGNTGRHPKLSDETLPSKSNLTFTGQLLNSMHSSVLRPGVFLIDFQGEHQPLTPTGKTISNGTLAYYVEKEGRPFIGPSDREVERLKKAVYDNFKTKITKSLSALAKKK